MKKVLALVLAVMMLATVAMASDIEVGNGAGGIASSNVEPGDTLKIYGDAFDGYVPDTIFTSEYFTITTKKFKKGADLVKEIKWNDDDECIDIVLKQDYDMTAPEKANLVIDALKVKCKKAIKKNGSNVVSKNAAWEYVGANGYTKDFYVGYLVGKIKITDDFKVVLDSGYLDKAATPNFDTVDGFARGVSDIKLVKFTDKDYGTANIEIADLAYVSGRVYKNEKVYLGYNTKVNIDLVKKYPDAELTFLNLNATFDGNMDFEIYADEGSYLYAVKDGKLTATNLKWDDDAYAFTGKVRTLGSYVISDTKLAVDAAAGSENPDTGANDVVGIATALAAVALVSAAAVSLKK